MGQGAAINFRQQLENFEAALAENASLFGTNIGSYVAATGTFPSNTQIWFAGKNSEGNFRADSLDKIGFGNTPAPKGHFILNAFDRDYSAVSGITDASFVALRQTDDTRPSCVEAAFGRVFYSGTQTAETQGIIYFSSVIGSTADLERCYQANDPTSEQLSDLLDSDGGAIQINNAGKIVALKEFRNGILALATNGVWHIRSGDDSAFKATNYIVEKICDIGALGRDSVVSAEGVVFYWSDAGIYAVSSDQAGFLKAESISQQTIQSFYNDISDIAKKYAIGKYSSREKKVIWLYKDDDGSVTANSQRNKFLEFDMNLGAFFPYKFADGTDTTVTGLFLKGFFGTEVVDDTVTVDGIPVTVSGIEVTVQATIDAEETPATKFVALRDGVYSGGGGDGEPTVSYYGITFYELNKTDYADPNGSYTAYAETNNINLGELMRDKQTPYLFCYFNRTEDGYELDGDGNIILSNQSSCFVRSKWDWTSTGSAGKWSNAQQVYRLKRLYIPASVSDPFDYDYDIVQTKTLIRGRGKTVRFRFEQEPGKGFELAGWAIPVTVGQTP